MCGINGAFAYATGAPPVEADELLRVREYMSSRGPDGAGTWLSPGGRAGLAHRRLAIIDLSPGGAQPMSSADGRYHITFNGEIYNYRALQDDLAASGVAFRSDSDTEVILALYARHGDATPRHLRGMYAFGIWDEVEQCLFLCRDSFGIKPLYLHDDGATLRFASQARALLASGRFAAEPDPAGQVGFWIWGHIPEPWTLWKGVSSLEAGTSLTVFRDGRRRAQVFQSVEDLLSEGRVPTLDGPSSGATREGVAAGVGRQDRHGDSRTLRESLLDSVRHHLVSDVPVGLFLSSGTDSTVLASLAMECGSELRTVTLGFEEYRGSALDETLVAEQVARQCGARHETVWLRREDFEGSVEAFFAAMDMPSIDGINTWMVSMAAARLGLKVALSGLGGDEFFGGYPSFRQVPLIRAITRPFSRPRSAGRLLRTWSAPLVRRLASEKFAGLLEYGPTWEGAYMLRRATRMPWELADSARLDPQVIRLGLEALASRSLPDSRLEGLARAPLIVSYLEAVRYMRGQLLRDTDWAGMSHSLEIRVPMVDVELTRHVARHNLRAAPYGKADLLGAIADPPTRGLVEGRAKLGFSVPIRDWISSAGHGRLKERGQLPWQEIVAGRFTELAAR